MLKSKLSTLALAIALTALGCLLSQLCPAFCPHKFKKTSI